MWYIVAAARYTSRRPNRLETRLKEHQDVCKRGMMEKSAVVEHAWENHHQIHWGKTKVITAEGRSCWWRRPSTSRWHPQRSTSTRWRTGSLWLLDHCDKEAGREEQSSLISDLQWCVSSVVCGYEYQCWFALLSLLPWWQLEHSVKMSANFPSSSWQQITFPFHLCSSQLRSHWKWSFEVETYCSF